MVNSSLLGIVLKKMRYMKLVVLRFNPLPFFRKELRYFRGDYDVRLYIILSYDSHKRSKIGMGYKDIQYSY